MHGLSLLLAGSMLLHFRHCVNLEYASNWTYDAATRQVLVDLEKEKDRSGKEKIRLGITWWFEPGINFYRETKHLGWLEKVTREGVNGNYDYYYISPEDIQFLPPGKQIVHEYPIAGSGLYK